jgi:hypothetical protein
MRTSQVENIFFHPVRSAAPQLSRKSLSLNELCSSVNRSHSGNRRETLVSVCISTTYNSNNSDIPLSPPVTFQALLALFGCHKSLFLRCRKSPQMPLIKDSSSPLSSLRLGGFA